MSDKRVFSTTDMQRNHSESANKSTPEIYIEASQTAMSGRAREADGKKCSSSRTKLEYEYLYQSRYWRCIMYSVLMNFMNQIRMSCPSFFPARTVPLRLRWAEENSSSGWEINQGFSVSGLVYWISEADHIYVKPMDIQEREPKLCWRWFWDWSPPTQLNSFQWF